MNFLIPGGLATGAGTLTVTTGNQFGSIGLSIANSAPGMFTADASGKGPAAAQAVVVAANGSIIFLPVAQCGASSCSTVAVPLAAGTQVYLVLYGTGLRSARNLTVSIGGTQSTVTYFGAQW